MVGHQIVVSRPYCSKNRALQRMRGIGQLSGLSAEEIVRRSCCLKCHRKDSMTSKELKLHRNEQAVRGRPTQKEVEHIRNGSVRMPYERSIYERTFQLTYIGNHVIQNELSNLNLYKKHLQKRHPILRRDGEPNSIPARTLQYLRNKSTKVREFVF